MSRLKDLLQEADSCKERISDAIAGSDEIQEYLDEYFRLDFIYSSNALDGSALTISDTRAVLADGVIPDGKTIIDCRTVERQQAAYHCMLETARQQDMTVTEDTVQKLNQLLSPKTDKAQTHLYRNSPVTLSNLGYTPAQPEDIPRLMGHFTDQVASSRFSLHPIELAAMAHKRLIDIYPYEHNNEKTARLLMNLILVHNGYGIISVPPVKRDAYFLSLSESRRLKDMEPFSILIAKCVITIQRKYCRLLKI